MKNTPLKILTGLLLTTQVQATDLYLPNLGKSATGTTSGARRGLDVYISGGSIGGTTSGSPYSLGDTGSLNLSVRKDSEGAFAGVIDGDYTPLQVDANGRLKVDAALTEAATAADGGALPALTKVTSGYDGTNVQALKTDATGSLQVDVESSALPSGAATEAKQDDEITQLTSANVELSSANTSLSSAVTELTAANVSLSAQIVELQSMGITMGEINDSLGPLGQQTMALSTSVAIASNQSAIPTTVSSSALPTGAATSANQTTAIGHLTDISSNTDGALTTLNSLNGKVTAVDTDNVTVISSALPTGAATEVTLADIEADIDLLVASNARNTSGSISLAAEDVSTVAETNTAPAGAVAFIIQADDTNTANIRFAVGAAATATRGIQIQAGRSEQLEVGADVSVIAESGTQKYQIQWVIK